MQVIAAKLVAPIVALAIAILCAGCGLTQVSLDQRGLTPITAENTPGAHFGKDSHGSVEFHPTLTGPTTTLSIDGVLWRFARLPCVESNNGDLVLLDTGMAPPSFLSLDVARDQKIPTHMGAPVDFACVQELSIGGIHARSFPAVIQTTAWACRAFWIPIYRVRGWALGVPLLAQAHYLAFDSPRARATIGFETFVPTPDRQWTSYEMNIRDGVPYVRLPVAGASLEFVADSGGGPRLIMTREQWESLAPAVRVKHHSTYAYPTWGRANRVDIYVVRDLRFGPLRLEDEPVWVLRADAADAMPSFGLGMFKSGVAVWDFRGGRFWVGQ